MTQVCKKCGIEKDENDFYFYKRSNRLNYTCKECLKQASKAQYRRIKSNNVKEESIHITRFNNLPEEIREEMKKIPKPERIGKGIRNEYNYYNISEKYNLPYITVKYLVKNNVI